MANLVIEDIEQRALSTFTSLPRFWKPYIDDPCTVLPTKDVADFHDNLNFIDPHIKFTVETEADHSLPFLDILHTRESDGTISTSACVQKTYQH